MKTVSKDGRTWFEVREGKTYVGFTKAFLDTLDGCWHIIPAASARTTVKENAPLCAVETNDGLFSVPSPVTGIISVFEHAAMNFPDKLSAEMHVATVVDKQQEEVEAPAEGARLLFGDEVRARINANLAQLNAQPEAPRAEFRQNLDFFANAGGAVEVNARNPRRGVR